MNDNHSPLFFSEVKVFSNNHAFFGHSHTLPISEILQMPLQPDLAWNLHFSRAKRIQNSKQLVLQMHFKETDHSEDVNTSTVLKWITTFLTPNALAS